MAPAPPHIPGYEILRTLGEGSYGAVFEARQLGLGRLVALKIVNPGAVDRDRVAARFKREAEVLARLRHPAIVGLFDAGQADKGVWYLAMELVRGTSLAQALERPWPWPRAVELARTLAEGLAAAHAQGVIHRDVKPSNVLLDERGAPRLADFGLSTLTIRGTTRLTRSGATPGTPQYLPPEAVEGREQGSAGDIYSLASTLMQLLTGEPAFGWLHTAADLHRRCLVPAPRLPPDAGPAWLADLLAAALDRDPELRPSAAELAACLAESRAPRGAPRGSTLALARRDLGTTKVRVRAGGLPFMPALAALAAGLGFWAGRPGPAPALPPRNPGPPPDAAPARERTPLPPAGMVLAGRRVFPVPLPEAARGFMPGSLRESSDLFVILERDPMLAASGWPEGGLEIEVPGPPPGAEHLVLAVLLLDGDPRRVEVVEGEGRSEPLALRASPADSPGTRLSVLTMPADGYRPGRWVLRPRGSGAGRLAGVWWGFAGGPTGGFADLEILAAGLRIGAVLMAVRLDAAAGMEGAALDPITGFFDVAYATRMGIHRQRGLLERTPFSGWVEGLRGLVAEADRRLLRLDPDATPGALLGYLTARWHLGKARTVLAGAVPELEKGLASAPSLARLCQALDGPTRAQAPMDADQPELGALRGLAAELRPRLGAGLGPWLDWLVERAILDGRSAGYGLPLDGAAALERVLATVEALPPGPPPVLLGRAALAREIVFLAGGTTGVTGQPVLALGPARARALEARALACLAALPPGYDRDRELELASALIAARTPRVR